MSGHDTSDQVTRVQSGAAERAYTVPADVPVLPLRDTVLFPNSFMPLAVARESSVRLIDEAIAGGKLIGVFAQRDPSHEEPGQDDLYPVGTLTHIHKMFKLPDGSLRLIVQGLARIRLERLSATRPYLRAEVRESPEVLRESDAIEIDALQRNVRSTFQQVVQLSPVLSEDLVTLASNINDVGRLADFVASSLSTIGTAAKQELLETVDVRERMDKLNRILTKELEVLELGSKIQSQVQSEVGKNQREYFLREQMKAIQRELGEGDDQAKELDELRQKIEAAGMPEDVKKEALRELDRLSKMPAAAAEYTVARTYIDWLVALPWSKRTDETIDLARTKGVLDADHSGLERVKDRIIEYLAVRKLKPDVKGPILCFVGPPGVGKTSLARSIARALGRKFVRVSLGGMRDEAEIRGHRRTYIGALPGQIIQGLRRAESRNPVFILDEIDKLGADFRGDPASALLEVLDPEQNNSFRDHYLDVPFDLSEVLFVTTANVLDTIPAPLRDRMEVLEIQGYTEEEKLRIARDHLVAKQIANHGLSADDVTFTDDAIRAIIRGYTREAGVRNLERELGAICRKLARRRAEAEPVVVPAPAAEAEAQVQAPAWAPAVEARHPQPPAADQPPAVDQPSAVDRTPAVDPTPAEPAPPAAPAPASALAPAMNVVVTPEVVEGLLGAPRHRDEEMKDRTKEPGVAIGLAWTPVGGDVLFVEASRMAGSSALTLTGSLGDVMKESARIALSWFRAHAPQYGVDPTFYKDSEIHLHVPSGAIPKDGPSAGVTMVCALASALNGRPVRGDLAMTGEITLSGRVLPVGGIKEKVLAARRAGLRQVILPRGNEKDVKEDLDEELRKDLVIHHVEEMDDVLKIALQPAPATRTAETSRGDEVRPRFSLA